MKKTLGVLVLTLSALVITAACASTGPPSKPAPQPDAGETWARAALSKLPSRPVSSAAVPTARLAE
jgi:photosystem II stability/assembly factor-like uncharacterized protein